MKPRYYNRSMLQCQCEFTFDANKSYYLYLKDYYNKNGNLGSKECSLLARRALDWIDIVIKYPRVRNIPYEEVQALKEIGLQFPYEENPSYITPLFRERSAEEQHKYEQFQSKLDNKMLD